MRFPPPELIRYTCGFDDEQRYFEQARDVYAMLDFAAVKFGGQGIEQYSNVLDFGCGAGRILQLVPPGPELLGVEINPTVLGWAKSNVPRGTYVQGTLDPPLNLAPSYFDLIYSFSVFSHLNKDREELWLEELARLGKPGCLYLITVHGDWVIEATLGGRSTEAVRSGFYYEQVHTRKGGSPLDFPPGYEASYHTSHYIRSNWNRYFEVLEVIDGRDPGLYRLDMLAPGDAQRPFAPMGQDLVVARRK